MEQPQIQVIHWYDVETRRIACGIAGQSGSTKHTRGVTCRACLEVLAESRAAARNAPAVATPLSYIH